VKAELVAEAGSCVKHKKQAEELPRTPGGKNEEGKKRRLTSMLVRFGKDVLRSLMV
jgi:hypothetical protein